MSLPASLLSAVASHRCFAARYKSEPATSVCLDPSQPPAPVLQASCSDCTLFRVGALASTLPSGITSQRLADDLSQHVCTVRGYLWSTSGYSATGGFWLSAAYYGNGLFLVDGSRNNNQSSDVDVLISAFRHGMVIPEHPRMLMPSLYTSEVVYLDMSQPITPVQSKADLLCSPRCRATRTPGFHRASILEFIPLARTAALQRSAGGTAPTPRPPARAIAATRSSTIAHPNPTTPASPAARPAQASMASARPQTTASVAFESDRCPFCGHEIKERPLFSGTFFGCLC